jgi:hypothetical protein
VSKGSANQDRIFDREISAGPDLKILAIPMVNKAA